ncbi:MAG: hypothetical protein IJM15_06560 [Erysipelotrichaceae bacterium]|nr:hypothetical protein [Erysipelotrichaceae bacterium]
MERKVLKLSNIVCLLSAVVFLPFDWRVSSGIVLGLSAFNVYYFLLSESITQQLRARQQSSLMWGARLLRLMILISAPVIGWFLPEIFNFYGTIIGVLGYKVVVYVHEFIAMRKKGGS